MGRGLEAVVVQPPPPLPLPLPVPGRPVTIMVKVAAVVAVAAEADLDLAEARPLANPESPKLHEPSWRERSKIAKRWRLWRRNPVVTPLWSSQFSSSSERERE